MDYRKVFNQAWAITKTHKFLWAFGLFLFLGNLFNFTGIYPQETSTGPQATLIADWISNHQNLVWGLSLASLVLIVLLVILYFRSQASIILSVSDIQEHKANNFRQAFAKSRVYYKQLFGISILIGLIMFVLTSALVLPIAYLMGQDLVLRAIILGVVGLIIFIPASLAARFLASLCPIFIVLYKMKIKESFKVSFDLVAKNWWQLLMLTVKLWWYFMLTFFLGVFLVSLIAIPVLFAGKIIMVIGLVISGIIFILIQAVFATFEQISWVLAFQELVKPQKTEKEPESAPVPEAVI